jgi:pyruvate/2-oxoglutarate dehydrogenase complex dihydrolipoamide dehydrogenase (E3) component
VHTHECPGQAAEIAHDVLHRGAEVGIHVRDAEVDFAAVMARVRRIIQDGSLYYERLLAERGVDLVRLPARFVSPHELEAGDLRVVSHALIATRAMGLDEVGIAYDGGGVTVDRHSGRRSRTCSPSATRVEHVRDREGRLCAIFIDPVLAAAGLMESQARAAGFEVEIRRSDVGTRGKARAIGDRRRRVKFVLDAGRA